MEYGRSMTSGSWFDALPTEDGWPGWAPALAEAMARPSIAGCRTKGEVLQEASKRVGRHPVTLRQQVSAWQFLHDHHPERLSQLSAETDVRPLAVLARHHAHAPQAVERLLDDTIAGRYSTAHLERRLKTSAQSEEPRSNRSDVVARAAGRAFYDRVHSLLEAHPALLTQAPSPAVIEAGRRRLVPADLVVLSADQEVAVVEIKAPRVTFHGRQAAESLGVLMLHARDGLDAWLVVPATWQDGLDRLVHLAADLDLPQAIRFATVDPDRPGPEAFHVVARDGNHA